MQTRHADTFLAMLKGECKDAEDYNEVSDGLSTASITLRACYEITAGGKQEAYVNLVTHLTYDRIKRLVADGATFAAATKQAEDELRTALGVGGSPPRIWPMMESSPPRWPRPISRPSLPCSRKTS